MSAALSPVTTAATAVAATAISPLGAAAEGPQIGKLPTGPIVWKPVTAGLTVTMPVDGAHVVTGKSLAKLLSTAASGNATLFQLDGVTVNQGGTCEMRNNSGVAVGVDISGARAATMHVNVGEGGNKKATKHAYVMGAATFPQSQAFVPFCAEAPPTAEKIAQTASFARRWHDVDRRLIDSHVEAYGKDHIVIPRMITNSQGEPCIHPGAACVEAGNNHQLLEVELIRIAGKPDHFKIHKDKYSSLRDQVKENYQAVPTRAVHITTTGLGHTNYDPAANVTLPLTVHARYLTHES